MRTHQVKGAPLKWENIGVHILPVSQTRVEEKGPWKGFTTKVLECLEREANPIFVFAGTGSYANSCTSKATKVILEAKRNESPFKNSDLFLKIDAYVEERDDITAINWQD